MSREILLRVLTGQMVGKYMMRELNRVAFLTQDDPLCISLVSASSSAFISQTGGNAGIYILSKENLTDIFDKIESNNYQAVFLGFGGNNLEEGKELFNNIFKEIVKRDMEIDIIVHFKMLTEKVVEKLTEDKEITLYLQGNNNLYIYSIDFDRGYLVLNFGIVHEGHIHLEEIEKFPLTFQHSLLLNSLIKKRNINWTNE